MSTDLTTGNEPQPETESAASQQRRRTEALVKAVEAKSDQLSTLLEDSGIRFSKFVEVFRRALIQNPDILRADAGSIIQSCMNACTDGLLPDGRQGAIVVRNVNVAQRGQPKRWEPRASWSPMYQGLLDVAYSSGNFKDIQARVVYAVDEFDYALGIDPWITHKPGKRAALVDDATRYEIVGAYAVAKGIDGGVWVEVFEPDDIQKVNAVSRATSGPGKTWPGEMARKGPLRRMWKFLPKNERMNRVAEHDDDSYDMELAPAVTQPERKLTPGFKPQAALPQGADPVVDLPMDGEEGELVDAGSAEAEFPGDRPSLNVQTLPDTDPDPTSPMEVFNVLLGKATSWLNIKQALKTFSKAPGSDVAWSSVCAAAWERRQEIGDKTEFVSDPWLWECWAHGSDPDADAIEANWRILSGTEAYGRADEGVKTRLQDLMESITGERP